MERISRTNYKGWIIIPEFLYSGSHQGIADFRAENPDYEKVIGFPRTSLMEVRKWIDEFEAEHKTVEV